MANEPLFRLPDQPLFLLTHCVFMFISYKYVHVYGMSDDVPTILILLSHSFFWENTEQDPFIYVCNWRCVYAVQMCHFRAEAATAAAYTTWENGVMVCQFGTKGNRDVGCALK